MSINPLFVDQEDQGLPWLNKYLEESEASKIDLENAVPLESLYRSTNGFLLFTAYFKAFIYHGSKTSTWIESCINQGYSEGQPVIYSLTKKPLIALEMDIPIIGWVINGKGINLIDPFKLSSNHPVRVQILQRANHSGPSGSKSKKPSQSP